MDTIWRERLLGLKHRQTDEEDTKYVSLVFQAMNRCGLEEARILMKTFTGEDDHGVQESVVGVLASAKLEVYMQALLEELPRLMNEAPQWAHTLIGRELYFNLNELVSSAKQANPEIVRILLTLLDDEPFAEFYLPNSRIARTQLEGYRDCT